jgi:hypothetical protein
LVESCNDRYFFSQLFQGFLFFATLFLALHVPSLRLAHLKRTAEDTLFTSQKVGRATENIVFSRNHEDIVPLFGYEYH